MVIDDMLLGCYKNLAFVLCFLGEEITDLFFIWQARHHWALAWKLSVISITGVGIEGREHLDNQNYSTCGGWHSITVCAGDG